MCCNELLLGLRAGIYRCLLGFGCLKAMVVLGTREMVVALFLLVRIDLGLN